MNRTNMSFQVTKPPEKKSNGRKNKEGRLLSQGEGSVQSVAERLRKRSTVEVPQGRRGKLGRIF
jgi:hypothetical protein